MDENTLPIAQRIRNSLNSKDLDELDMVEIMMSRRAIGTQTRQYYDKLHSLLEAIILTKNEQYNVLTGFNPDRASIARLTEEIEGLQTEYDLLRENPPKPTTLNIRSDLPRDMYVVEGGPDDLGVRDSAPVRPKVRSRWNFKQDELGDPHAAARENDDYLGGRRRKINKTCKNKMRKRRRSRKRMLRKRR